MVAGGRKQTPEPLLGTRREGLQRFEGGEVLQLIESEEKDKFKAIALLLCKLALLCFALELARGVWEYK